MKIRIARKFKFEASHYLPNHEGPCKRLHGHSYLLLIEIRGEVEEDGPQTGMVMDYGNLKKLIETWIIGQLDHTHLNDSFPNPTAEVMVKWIVSTIRNLLPTSYLELTKVRLHETSNSYAEWRIEDENL